jgi:hypothetical protein
MVGGQKEKGIRGMLGSLALLAFCNSGHVDDAKVFLAFMLG